MKRITILAALVLTAPLAAQDWPQFRGDGTQVSKEKNLPVKWSATDNIRWSAELPGGGLGNPVVAAGRVFVTACTGPQQKRLHVLCFDLKTGKQLWERQFWGTGLTACHPKTNMAAPTPCTDGKLVFALFATNDLFCLDLDGNLVWARSFTHDYPTIGNNVGMATSPVLHRDLLILDLENVGESYALGIDKATGQNKWKAERPRGINWTTPLIVQHNGREEVILQNTTEIVAHDPASGKRLWSYKGTGFRDSASPSFGDGLVLIPGARFQAIRPETSAETPAQVWSSNKLPVGYASPIPYEGRVYTLSGNGILNCAELATGKPLWDKRLEGEFAATPLLADGKLYVVNEKGTTTVLELGKEGAKVLATNELPETILACPIAADGAIFLRSDQRLYCIGKK